MKTCFATVIYKQAKPYFKDLLASLASQTDKDFDLLLLNDNYSQADLIEMGILSEAGSVNDVLSSVDGATRLVDCSSKKLSIAQNRIELLRSAKDAGYELAIIGDADDTFAAERVEKLKAAAKIDKESVFFYNKLIKENGDEVFKTLPECVDDINLIAQENFLGMSTTAIRVDKLSDAFLESLSEGDCNVFDWYLFSRIVLDIGPGKYVPEGATIYRIYDDNEVGVTRDLKQEKRVKLTHYANLAKRYPQFKKYYEEMERVDVSKVQHSKDHQGYWWSDIRIFD